MKLLLCTTFKNVASPRQEIVRLQGECSTNMAGGPGRKATKTFETKFIDKQIGMSRAGAGTGVFNPVIKVLYEGEVK